jgi:hypothetical protein
MIARARWLGLWTSIAAIVAVTACTPPIKQYDIKDESLGCDEANRFAYQALTGMGFEVTEFEPAAPGRRGTLRGTRERSGTQAGTQSAVVKIDCDPEGVSVVASDEGNLLGQRDLKWGFYLGFLAARDTSAVRKEMEGKIAAGTAPESMQRRDVRILLNPIADHSAKLDFGFHAAARGVLPLRVRINNLTERSYLLDPEAIRLTRADRQRVRPISPDQAAALITAARDADTKNAVTPMSLDEVSARLRQKLFTVNRLPPGAEADGFLYFPAGDYERGRVLLTEEASGETEGFLIEF